MKAFRRFAVRLLLLAALISLTATPASAAIELLYFTVETDVDFIHVDWQTATELNNAGFFVRRNTQGGTNPALYTPVPVIDATSGAPFTFIPARGDGLIGALYNFRDEDVVIGTRYYYFLEDVDTSNVSGFTGPVEAVAGQTATPTVTPTRTNTPLPPTATPTATRTPTRTNTPGPGTPSVTPIRTPSRTPTRPPTRTNTPAPGVRTDTPTPQPSPTPEFSPTPSNTLDPGLSPVDATLTAIAQILSATPTATIPGNPIARVTEEAARATAAPPTATRRPPAPTAAAQAEPAADAGAVMRLALVALVFLGSGALLTGGIIFLARRTDRDEA
jgi:hypothetical protein